MGEIMYYKRISRGYWNYALFPDTINIDDIIAQNSSKDYYESIYKYEQEHYDKFVNALKKACLVYKVKFDESNLLDVTATLTPLIKKLADKNDQAALELKDEISVAGTNNIKTDKLVFDFDEKNDVEKARQDALELVGRLIQNGLSKDNIQVSFSGNKGFSVEVETNSEFNRKEFENIVNNLASGLNTFDPSVKDHQRLFRIPLTVHNVSGLYKVPLTLDQLEELTYTQIKNLATPKYVEDHKDQYYEIINSWVRTELTPSIKSLKNLTTTEKKELDENKSFNDTLDLSKKPNWLTATKFALQEGFFFEGERNNAFMILCATYKKNGFPKRIAWGMLKGVAELQSQRTGQEKYSKDELWHNIVDVIYSPHWKGGTYSEKETDLLKKTAERLNITLEKDETRLTTINVVSERFKTFATNIDKNTIKMGIKTVDENVLITTQMTLGILGSPSSGKTTLANNFVKNLSLNGQKSIYQSLDMGDNLLFGRLLQHYCGYDFKLILNMIKRNEWDKNLLEAWERVKEEYKNVGFNFKSGTNVEDIEADILKYKEKHGDELKLVVVDYLEKVRGPYSDSNANTAYVASRLADLSTQHNLCLLMLLQPQKSAGDPSHPLLSMRKVKGASVIEQDSRVILTLWRPGFDPENFDEDNYLSMAVVKNNMGPLTKLDFHWDGASGKIRDLSFGEQVKLEALLKRKEDEKKAEKISNDDW